MKAKAVSRWLLATVFVAGAAFATWKALYDPCVSRARGVRGEVMRQADGTYLYFNGECWTTKPVVPTDSPF